MVRWMISMGLEDLCLEWDGWMDWDWRVDILVGFDDSMNV